MKWSEQQIAIFDWFREGEGNLVVRARAGTGKTSTILEGINYAPEEEIMLCAFNVKIKDVLNARLKNPRAQARTLHSIGNGLVKRYWPDVKLARYSDRADSATNQVCDSTAPDPIKRLVSKLHTKARESMPHARDSRELEDMAYSFECVPDESWESDGYGLEYVTRSAVRAMEVAATVKPNEIDFADMIFLPVRNHWLTKLVDLVVVDEAQDMVNAQLEMAIGICRGRVAIVGDDRQAIYGFRGADSGSLDRLKKELKAKELGLKTTYRCGKVITAAAALLVPDIEAAETSPDGEILSLNDQKLVETAALGDFILSRLNAPLVSTAMALLRSNKRACIAGRDIGAGLKALVRKLSRKHDKTIESFLKRLAEWERKESDKFIAIDRPQQADLVRDKTETLYCLAEGAVSTGEIESRIDTLFTDDGLGSAGVVTCSTVHRAKGLEASRVFILDDTLYPRGVTQEECNIEYVAVTRAKTTLVRVSKNVLLEKPKGRQLSQAPCDQCGYNGVGYFQPETHPCAAAHHAGGFNVFRPKEYATSE